MPSIMVEYSFLYDLIYVSLSNDSQLMGVSAFLDLFLAGSEDLIERLVMENNEQVLFSSLVYDFGFQMN